MLPVCINLKSRLVLIVGGGKYALRKAQNLVGEGCRLRVISTSLLSEFDNLDLDLEYINARYDAKYLAGVFMVWACTDSVATNAQVLADCEERNILCTAAHCRTESHFINPLYHKGADFSFALWTGGKNPVYTQKLRDFWVRAFATDFWEAQVYLAGFGPGSMDLMTLKCLNLIRTAEVILYDDLIDPKVLELTQAESIYVGKRMGQNSMKQTEINQMLLQKSQEYSKVLRLKGGDPFVFGRGGEELDFLQSHGVHVQVVPGITSALAAAASAQVPLTHRGISRSLTLQTAHHLDDSPPEFPKSGTLALYMGAHKLAFLRSQLLEQGWSLATPVVLVHAVGHRTEKIEYTVLDQMHLSTLASPLSVLIGESLGLHHRC